MAAGNFGGVQETLSQARENVLVELFFVALLT